MRLSISPLHAEVYRPAGSYAANDGAPVVALGPAGFATVTGMFASGLHYFPVTLRADVLNLNEIQGLGAPIASIGRRRHL